MPLWPRRQWVKVIIVMALNGRRHNHVKAKNTQSEKCQMVEVIITGGQRTRVNSLRNVKW